MSKHQKKRAELYSLLLLAGGKNSRMGRDKAELLIDGRSFLSCLLEKAESLGIQEKYISGERNFQENAHIVPDRYPDRGPLGGMEACMRAAKTPYCLVLPVDVPQIPEEVLESLLLFHEKTGGEKPLLLSHGGRIEPLIGIYPAKMADVIEEVIKEKAVPVFRVLDKWGYEVFPVILEEQQAYNINTPQEYQQLLACREKRNQ